MEMNTNLLDVLRGFRLDAEPVSCEPYGCGHINVTYLAVAASGRRYILQRINHHTFRDIPGLMENITAVTEFLRAKANDPRSVLTLVKTHDGASFLHTQDAYWRVYDFVLFLKFWSATLCTVRRWFSRKLNLRLPDSRKWEYCRVR